MNYKDADPTSLVVSRQQLKRVVSTIVAFLACSWAIWEAARVGIARSLAERAEVTGEATAANRAVRFAPRDPETHFARGVALQQDEDYAEASVEFERAAQLRPRDYYLWLLLGVTRDENQDQDGALRALRQAVKLAPNYAPPRWQLGNLLLRMGQIDEAFAELRAAAIRNPTLWPNVIDLAWGIYSGDSGAVIDAIKPETDTARLSLAIFFARHNRASAALDQFRRISTISNTQNESLLSALLETKSFTEAYEVWSRMRALPNSRASETSVEIRNGGFEQPIAIGQAGFDWQITPNVANVTVSLDPNEHQQGSRSLRIDFRGNSNPTSPLLSQLILVRPQTGYRLTFAAQAREFVSASLPVITVKDASDPRNATLVQSPPLRSDTGGWHDFAIEFTTNAGTQAIAITVARQSCAADPCPAFGTLWLDSFFMVSRDSNAPKG